jgi:hypothetical protein
MIYSQICLKLHNEEFHNFYTSPDIIGIIKSKRNSWAGHLQCSGEMKNKCNILVGKTEGKT